MADEQTTEAVAETDVENLDTAEPVQADPGNDDDTFPRQVVEDLRREAAGYRDRAKTAEARVTELARQRHEALVRLDGRLQDATDLAFDPDNVLEPDQITKAIAELVAAKPHLKSRKPTGDIGQGVRGGTDEPFSLIGALKAL